LLFAAPGRVETVRNERVIVTDITLEPGQIESLPANPPCALVYMTDGSIEIQHEGTAPLQRAAKRGESGFIGGAGVIKNVGPSAIHLVRVDLLIRGKAEAWGASGLSPNYRVISDNQFARIYEIRIPAHTREPQHAHHDRVVVCLSGAALKHL